LLEQLEVENERDRIAIGGHINIVPVDGLILDNELICQIKRRHQDEAFSWIARNEIMVLVKEQFQSGEASYGTIYLEMVHSTGTEGVIGRLQRTSFGSKE